MHTCAAGHSYTPEHTRRQAENNEGREREGRKERGTEGGRERERAKLTVFPSQFVFFSLWNSLALDKDNKYTGTVHG